MKSAAVRKAFALAVVLLGSFGEGHAGVIFSDDFASGPSSLWGNESGDWTASSGAYFATAPNNQPNAYSSVPYDLRNFAVDFDINDVSDGGIFLRATPEPATPCGIKGILLNFKVPGGARVYWHIFYDGTDASPPLNVTNADYGNNLHVHVEVSGDTYSAFINGSTTPVTTLTTNLFSSGRVALYDFSGQTFSNFILETPPQPSLFIRMDSDAAVIYWSTAFPDYVLQTTTDASLTTGWISFAGPYVSANGFYQYRLPLLNLLHKQFFRLISTN